MQFHIFNVKWDFDSVDFERELGCDDLDTSKVPTDFNIGAKYMVINVDTNKVATYYFNTAIDTTVTWTQYFIKNGEFSANA